MLQGSASRPASGYLDMPMPQTSSPLGGFEDHRFNEGPTDRDLEIAIRELLRGADLNTVTKRAVRQKLEERFGLDLASRKATINSTIDRVLLSQN
jgi:chitin synthase